MGNVTVPLSEGAAEREVVLLRRKLQGSAQPGVVTGSRDLAVTSSYFTSIIFAVLENSPARIL